MTRVLALDVNETLLDLKPSTDRSRNCSVPPLCDRSGSATCSSAAFVGGITGSYVTAAQRGALRTHAQR